jgi:hypothetical protein
MGGKSCVDSDKRNIGCVQFIHNTSIQCRTSFQGVTSRRHNQVMLTRLKPNKPDAIGGGTAIGNLV